MDSAGTALLRLSANPDAHHGADLAALSEAEWRVLFDRASEARLVPLLARAIEQIRPAVPAEVAAAIAEQRHWHALNALRQRATIARLALALNKLGHDPLMLKGVALAYRSYPAADLRPMRDLDVLLPAEFAAEAQRALIATGDYTVHPDLRGTRRTSPEHFPPLQDVALATTIEVHHRVGTWGGAETLQRALLASSVMREIGGATVRVPSNEANLLHLVAGAVIKDRLALSALVLADLHYLAAGPLDWEAVLRLADEVGLRNALALLSAVAAHNGATWVPPQLTGAMADAESHVPAAVAALTQPAAQAYRRRIVDRVERAGEEQGAGHGALRLALSPEPMQLAKIAGVAPASAWRWAAYPVWLIQRTLAYLRAAGEARRGGGDGADRMRDWVEDK